MAMTGWVAQNQDNVTEWDIQPYCQRTDLRVRQYYKVVMSINWPYIFLGRKTPTNKHTRLLSFVFLAGPY